MFVSYLSGIIVLYYLMSNILKIVTLCVFSSFFIVLGIMVNSPPVNPSWPKAYISTILLKLFSLSF